jgi:hypothetical protein
VTTNSCWTLPTRSPTPACAHSRSASPARTVSVSHPR